MIVLNNDIEKPVIFRFVSNTIDIAIDTIRPELISLGINNGKITGCNGRYSIKTSAKDSVLISIYCNNKLLEVRTLKVIEPISPILVFESRRDRKCEMFKNISLVNKFSSIYQTEMTAFTLCFICDNKTITIRQGQNIDLITDKLCKCKKREEISYQLEYKIDDSIFIEKNPKIIYNYIDK